MWWKTSLNNLIDLIYKDEANEDLIKDWLIAYEYETGDSSLQGVNNLVSFLMNTNYIYRSLPNVSRSRSKSHSKSTMNDGARSLSKTAKHHRIWFSSSIGVLIGTNESRSGISGISTNFSYSRCYKGIRNYSCSRYIRYIWDRKSIHPRHKCRGLFEVDR